MPRGFFVDEDFDVEKNVGEKSLVQMMIYGCFLMMFRKMMFEMMEMIRSFQTVFDMICLSLS